MAKTKPYFITTAIDYVNAAPHIGHAYEKVLGDVVARWHRLQGEKVHFLTGTDENAQKNAQAAKEVEIDTQKFVDKNAQHFIDLCKQLNISYDEFIRTTSTEHKKKANEIIKAVHAKGDIYKGSYEGLYCDGCEEYKTEKDLIEGKCPEHKKPVRTVSEEAYFFKLSKYQKQIITWIEKQKPIIPAKRANEILSRLKEEDLKDLCITRKNVDWGIPFPLEKNFTTYVWFDALINYITGAGKGEVAWPADVHLIGKGISWFHTVIWPAILLSAGYDLPKHVWVHGYFTVNGQKMSKSLGNVFNPLDLLKKYPADTLRYFLVREIPFENDGDFSEEALKERHNNELANKLGNLVSRVSALAEKYGLEKTEIKSVHFKETQKKIEENMQTLHIDRALQEIFSFIDQINEYVQQKKPWETKDTKVLYETANAIKDITILLSPFLPETAEKIAKIFNFDIDIKELNKPLKISKIKKAEILFQKI